MTYVVALTGGIGTGKTTVSNYFENLGVPVIDTDIIARELVEPKTACYHQILERFGAEILNADASLDRKQLRHIIFTNEKDRQWLEQLLHPKIIQTVQEGIKNCQLPYCVVVIPLLVELYDQFQPFIHRILVVDTNETLQRNRVMTRDHCSQAMIDQILKTQVNREQRLDLADDILHNEGDLKALEKGLSSLHKKYLLLAKKNLSE